MTKEFVRLTEEQGAQLRALATVMGCSDSADDTTEYHTDTWLYAHRQAQGWCSWFDFPKHIDTTAFEHAALDMGAVVEGQRIGDWVSILINWTKPAT